jgi:membrane-associated protease RseP (regulator of RpoE activity)
VLAIVWIGLFLLFPPFKIDPGNMLKTVLLSIIFSLLVYYPLSCSLVHVYRRLTGKTKDKHLFITILIILLVNPFTLGLLISGATSVKNNVINYPCGAEVTGFSPESPALSAGMTAGEVITSADGENIDNTDAFIHAMANKKEGDTITITTEKGTYNVNVMAGPEGRGGVIGIQAKGKYCER